MKRSQWAVLMLSMTLAGSAVLAIGDATTQPTRKAKLPKPFTRLTSLTDDQKAQITDIHEKYERQIETLEKEQLTEEKAVLNQAQLSELEAIEAKDKADQKADRAAERAEKARNQANQMGAPTTAPAGGQ